MIFCLVVHTMEVKWVVYCFGTNIVQNIQVWNSVSKLWQILNFRVNSWLNATWPHYSKFYQKLIDKNNSFPLFSPLNCKCVLIALAQTGCCCIFQVGAECWQWLKMNCYYLLNFLVFKKELHKFNGLLTLWKHLGHVSPFHHNMVCYMRGNDDERNPLLLASLCCFLKLQICQDCARFWVLSSSAPPLLRFSEWQ